MVNSSWCYLAKFVGIFSLKPRTGSQPSCTYMHVCLLLNKQIGDRLGKRPLVVPKLWLKLETASSKRGQVKDFMKREPIKSFQMMFRQHHVTLATQALTPHGILIIQRVFFL